MRSYSFKRHFTKSACTLYLCYFCFYAVTPLSFSCAAASSPEDNETYIKNAGLFIVELLGSKLFDRHAPETNRSPLKFLLLKKRAVVPETGLSRTGADNAVLFAGPAGPKPHSCRFHTGSPEPGHHHSPCFEKPGRSPPFLS